MTAGELIVILAEWPDDAPVMVAVAHADAYTVTVSDVREVYRMPNGTVIIEG